MSRAPPPPPPPPPPRTVSAYTGLQTKSSKSLEAELEARVHRSEDIYSDCATSLFGFEMSNKPTDFYICKLCSSRVTNQYAHLNTHICEIFPWLYIGSMNNALDLIEIKHVEATVIINCTSECQNNFQNAFKYYNFPIADSANNIYLIKEAGFLIENLRLDGEKVLIHCVQGACRAPCVVMFYLMRFHGMSLREAYGFVKDRRSIVRIRRNLLSELIEIEKEIFGMASLAVEEIWQSEDD